MSNKIIDYFTSDKFREDMAKVGPGTPPYGHSTPTPEILQIIEDHKKKQEDSS